ncbi:envelope glycoprotein G [Saimiriine alphaherpesvirus 1]|uniref:Envelope glycoprotein G n=1 Tax=Saimiriine herpesvirus 1 (strain MV-5-4-PSL) TaxID=10353 RepID=E2IUH6_SHV1|nr:envelope glycoprotein G [Saimiriine alphaherpesvirus 1]ADO13834.1 envelope glycoprotein G [Saimiriine alphaherpesvirus 1]
MRAIWLLGVLIAPLSTCAPLALTPSNSGIGPPDSEPPESIPLDASEEISAWLEGDPYEGAGYGPAGPASDANPVFWKAATPPPVSSEARERDIAALSAEEASESRLCAKPTHPTRPGAEAREAERQSLEFSPVPFMTTNPGVLDYVFGVSVCAQGLLGLVSACLGARLYLGMSRASSAVYDTIA